jgi:hypothetical protein
VCVPVCTFFKRRESERRKLWIFPEWLKGITRVREIGKGKK